MNQLEQINRIGADLVNHANETEFSARGVLDDLFPYVYRAAKRMSTRAISRWLQDAHNVKLSAVSIAKALREPERFWEKWADSIEPTARAIEDVTQVSMAMFLTDQDAFQHLVKEKKDGLVLNDAEQDQVLEAIWEHESEVKELEERWWTALDSIGRERCLRYLPINAEETNADFQRQ